MNPPTPTTHANRHRRRARGASPACAFAFALLARMVIAALLTTAIATAHLAPPDETTRAEPDDGTPVQHRPPRRPDQTAPVPAVAPVALSHPRHRDDNDDGGEHPGCALPALHDGGAGGCAVWLPDELPARARWRCHTVHRYTLRPLGDDVWLAEESRTPITVCRRTAR